MHYTDEKGGSDRCLGCHVGGGPLHVEDSKLSPKMAGRRDTINSNIQREWGALAKSEEFDWREVLPLYGKMNEAGEKCVQRGMERLGMTPESKQMSMRKIVGAARCIDCHDGKDQPSFTGYFTRRDDVGPHHSILSGSMPKDNNLSQTERKLLSDHRRSPPPTKQHQR